jgi:hypothetical protein
MSAATVNPPRFFFGFDGAALCFATQEELVAYLRKRAHLKRVRR